MPESVTEIADRFVDEQAVLDPAGSIRRGVDPGTDELTDYSPEGAAARADHLARTRDALRAVEPVDEAERLGAGYLDDVCSAGVALYEAREHERMVSAIVGPPAGLRMAFDLMDQSTPEAWATVGRRLEHVPEALAGYRRSLEAGLVDGPPASTRLVEEVAEQCATWGGAGDGGWFAAYVAAAGDDADRDRLDAAARTAAAAYGELAVWLRRDFAPRATDVDGVGDDRYRVWARSLLGADLDLDDSYAWGCGELARLEAEKDVECERILPGAPFEEVQELLSTDPAYVIEGVEPYRAWLQGVVDEATEALAGAHFEIPPQLRRCEVSIPPEGSAAAPYYTPPSEDLTAPGRVWFPTLGDTVFPRWDQVTTAYHEAVPGHHLQVGTTRIVPLTRAHRFGFNSAHGEGWALYAERLMDELGWFTTPDIRLGFLCMQAFRAARVVVDIGLHTGRPVPAGAPGEGGPWTFELAVAFIERASGLSNAFATSEVLRYLSWPGQAPCYKLGERTWLEGRAQAQQAAGPSFDLRAWHARALALGSLGLDRLARELVAAA